MAKKRKKRTSFYSQFQIRKQRYDYWSKILAVALFSLIIAIFFAVLFSRWLLINNRWIYTCLILAFIFVLICQFHLRVNLKCTSCGGRIMSGFESYCRTCGRAVNKNNFFLRHKCTYCTVRRDFRGRPIIKISYCGQCGTYLDKDGV
jgi:DNA-directed RNA polymerase subunit RPC12/RpoP